MMLGFVQSLLPWVSGSKGGKSGGGGAGRVAQEAPNTLQSKAVLRAVEFISEGEIKGLVNGAKSIFFDDTPLQNSDNTFNFNGVAFQQRLGTPDQQHISGFSAVETEVPVGVKVVQSTPVVRTITDADTDAVNLTIRLNALTEQNTTNGDLSGSSVSFTIEYQPNGGSYITAVDATQGTITGKTTSTYDRQYRFNLTGSAPWNIRVTRVTPDSPSIAIQNDIYFSSYTRIIDHKLIYPDTAAIGLEVDSSLFGANIPQRSYEIDGLLLKVPSNYNPVTRVYTGIWNGTFQLAWSDNPAWALYNLITNKRYGLGEYIDEAEVDKYGFYTIAQYCDELVPDGVGGMEPRFRFNAVIETQEDALKVLQVVASAFRGMLYWGAEGNSGIVTAVHDAPSDPVKLFSEANVIGGLFTYSSASAQSRHSAALVTWNNPDNGYKAEIEVVESAAILDFPNYRTIPVVAYGCTSRSQAHRFGKWILDTELYSDETVSFSVGLADADVRPGQVISIQDASYANVRYSGRILGGATLSSLTLDAPVQIDTGKTYTLTVLMPDGTLETRGVTNSVGLHTVLTLASNLSAVPDNYAVWVITASDLAPRQFRVIAVKETNAANFEVSALLHDPTKYARVENNLSLPPLTFSRIESGQIKPPSGITFRAYFVANGPSAMAAINVSWVASPDSRVTRYELEVKSPATGSNYELAVATNGLSHVIENAVDGVWSFRVRAFDALNTPSIYAVAPNQTVLINSAAPGDVSGFQITNLGNTSALSWNPVTSVNLSHYEVRFSSDAVTPVWNAALSIIARVPKDSTTVTVASRTGSFLIKAVTLPTASFPSGVYSANAAIVTTNIDFLTNFNFIQNLVESPTFAGAKVNCIVRSGRLEMFVIGAGTGTYTHQSVIDLGAVYTSRVTPNISVFGNRTDNNVDNWTNVDNITDVDGETDGLWSVRVEVSTTNDNTAGSPVWSPYRALDAGDILARGLRFRTILTSNSAFVTPSIDLLSVTVDMPDLIQSGENLTSSAVADTVVTFGYTFRSSRPAVVITAQGMATGDYYTVTSITASGFVINFYNAAGTRISRTFDYHTKGYGIVT